MGAHSEDRRDAIDPNDRHQQTAVQEDATIVKTIRSVILANPCSDADPIFYRNGDAYLFPQVIKWLHAAGMIHDPVISIGTHVSSRYLDIISQWDVPCAVSSHELPQHRLAEISDTDSSDGYLLLTPYSYLLEKERLTAAVQNFSDNDAQYVHFKGTSSSSAFCICDRAAVHALSAFEEFSITPFVAAQYLFENKRENKGIEIELSDEDSVEALLFMLLYYGDKGILPELFIANYFATATEKDRFISASYAEHLASYFSIAHFDDFLHAAARLTRDARLDTIAGQVHLVTRLVPYLPEKKECFVELGFGASPTASLLLLNLFHRGYAIEPFLMRSIDCELVEFISKNITIPGYIDLEATQDCPQVLKNLDIRTSRIQECGIPNESVDFVFSKTVFEHIDDVPDVSQTLYDILKPGGSMYHIVDFRDHVDTSSIRFDFLRHSKESWASITKSTNLWRINDLVDLWREIGFEVEIVEQLSRVMELQDIHPCWDAYDPKDLFCYHAVLVAEKPVREGASPV